ADVAPPAHQLGELFAEGRVKARRLSGFDCHAGSQNTVELMSRLSHSHHACGRALLPMLEPKGYRENQDFAAVPDLTIGGLRLSGAAHVPLQSLRPIPMDARQKRPLPSRPVPEILRPRPLGHREELDSALRRP